jgi:predicted DCC family thiol-disulfide oxidoreductase YuxK
MSGETGILNQARPLVLFDGVCNLCDASVQFILKRDRKKVFRFAALQSPLGRKIGGVLGLPENSLNTMILVENGRAHLKSGAALRICRRLSAPWPLLFVFILVPRFLRDIVYDFIAGRRYRWFGKKEQCWIPDPEWRERFLDSVESGTANEKA